MENMYAADGTKLRVQYYLSDGTLDKERSYFGGFEYEKAQTGSMAMTQFPMSEGRITCSGGTYAYEYQMKDHLGNVRASFACASGAPVMQQEDYYYPFGLSFRMKDAASANRYLYNGKEKEDFHNLGWNDYGARFYDPQLGRWHVMDPLNQYHSPYVYVGNKPTILIDKNGENGSLPNGDELLDPSEYNSLTYDDTYSNDYILNQIKNKGLQKVPLVLDFLALCSWGIDETGSSSMILSGMSTFASVEFANYQDAGVGAGNTVSTKVLSEIKPAWSSDIGIAFNVAQITYDLSSESINEYFSAQQTSSTRTKTSSNNSCVPDATKTSKSLLHPLAHSH